MTDSRPENVPAPAAPIVVDGCGHKHYRQEFRFEGKGFFGRIHAAILNWLRRNSD
jgi:hypothetical protein